MKTLISSNEILQKYVPNTLKAVAGELSLFDKIAYHLQQSETWLTQTFYI
jgi:alpha-acetolactate decarboxylase